MKHLTDKEIETRLNYIYKVANKLLNTRMNGAEQYDKYNTKTRKHLKNFIIAYENEYRG